MTRTRDSNWVVITLVFKERQGVTGISKLARQVCDPGSPLYGQDLSLAALARATGPPAGAVAHCRRWFVRKGLRFHTTPNAQFCWAEGNRTTVRQAFGPEADAWLKKDRVKPPRRRWPLPSTIAAHLKSISVTDFQTHRLALAVKGLSPELSIGRTETTAVPSRKPPRAKATPAAISQVQASPAGSPGMAPEDIRAIYDFPAAWTGAGETIFLLNLGSRVDEEDLQGFWRAHGVDRDPHLTEQVDLGRPMRSQGFVQQLEPTMGAQWIGALAPDARLIVYNIDSEAAADPWSAFLAAAVTPDRTGRQPTIAVSTWSLPERLYFARHGRGVFADLLEQAAVAGITMIAASGDWGVYDGRPSAQIDGVEVAEAPWPHGVFPSVEDYVLSVGGTMITSRHPLTERAWSGPLPPNEDLRRFLPFHRLGSSGGFSEDVAIPWWQEETLRPRGVTRHFRRGLNLPAVLPSGRGYPDVALMAQGAAVAYPADRGLASVGYGALVAGQHINYAGGTSMGAPVWAAIVACMNQARRSSGLPRVGFVNPLLYALAARIAAPGKKPFRPITVGASDVELRVVDETGRPTRHRLYGFSAGDLAGIRSPAWGCPSCEI